MGLIPDYILPYTAKIKILLNTTDTGKKIYSSEFIVKCRIELNEMLITQAGKEYNVKGKLYCNYFNQELTVDSIINVDENLYKALKIISFHATEKKIEYYEIWLI